MAKKKQTNPSKRKIQVRVVFGFILFMFLFFQSLKWLEKSETFVLKHIEVDGISILEAEEVIRLSALPVGKRILNINLQEAETKIAANLFVKTVKVSRNLPSTIFITIAEYRPAAFINAGELYVVDETGIVLPHIIPKQVYDLPVISGIKDFQPVFGEKTTSKKILKGLDIIKKTRIINKTLFYNISEVNVEKDIKLYTAHTGTKIILGDGDMGKKLTHLDAFLTSAEDRQKKLYYIDLRFDEQVIIR